VKDSSHLSIHKHSVILGCSSAQDDATVKCWGANNQGFLGQGDTTNRGELANGPCPPSPTTAAIVPAPRILTLGPALGEQRWGSEKDPCRHPWAVLASSSPSLLSRRDGRQPSCGGVGRLLGRGHCREGADLRHWQQGGRCLRWKTALLRYPGKQSPTIRLNAAT